MAKTEMERALEADGEKLRQLTGEEHGPWRFIELPRGSRPCKNHGFVEVAPADGSCLRCGADQGEECRL